MPIVKIVEINYYCDFLALEEKWCDILKKRNESIFSTWDWLSIWWKHFGDDKKLMLLLAEDGDGEIMGIAPLMYSIHKMFGLRMGKIEFIGTPDTDYHNFILADKDVRCIRLFIDYLHNNLEKWDCIQLTDIPETANSLSVLANSAKSLTQIHRCPYSLLPRSHETFMNNLERKHRKDLRRNLKRLEKNFRAEFVDCSEPQLCMDGMAKFFELHQQRWTSKGNAGAFASPKFRSFHRDIAKSFSQKGWLGLFLLEISGMPVAALYGFRYRSKFYYYLSGFDPRYAKYGVGSLLILHVINKGIQDGLAEFDFMRGAESYKDQWNTITRWNYEAIITRKGLLASLENRLYKEYWHQGSRLKYLLKIK